MRMIADRRSQSAGSALHLRLTGVFAFVALVPTILVAVFAVPVKGKAPKISTVSANNQTFTLHKLALTGKTKSPGMRKK